MTFFWWGGKEFNENFENETQVTPKKDQEKKPTNKSETLQTHQGSNGNNRWTFNFFRKRSERKKVNVGVGDDVVDEEKVKLSIWKRLFKKNDEIEKKTETKIPIRSDRLDKLVHGFKREATIVQKEIIASTIASVISTLLSHPFDVVKSIFLSSRIPKRQFDSHIRRRRIVYILKHIIITKGLTRLYRGHIESQRNTILQAISMFWTYRQVFHYLNGVDNLKEHPDLIYFVSGFVSATIPVMALHPIDILRERQDIKRVALKKFGPIIAKSVIRSKKHFRPLFRTCCSLYLHMGTLYGLRFLFYNRIREEMMLLRTTRDKATSTNPNVSAVDTYNRLTHFQLMLAGGIAAVLGDLVAHPLDVLHTRMSMPPLQRQQLRFDHTCRRLGQCFMTILKNESILAFYSGLVPSMLRSMVSVAVQFTVYDKAKNWLNPLFPT